MQYASERMEPVGGDGLRDQLIQGHINFIIDALY